MKFCKLFLMIIIFTLQVNNISFAEESKNIDLNAPTIETSLDESAPVAKNTGETKLKVITKKPKAADPETAKKIDVPASITMFDEDKNKDYNKMLDEIIREKTRPNVEAAQNNDDKDNKISFNIWVIFTSVLAFIIIIVLAYKFKLLEKIFKNKVTKTLMCITISGYILMNIFYSTNAKSLTDVTQFGADDNRTRLTTGDIFKGYKDRLKIDLDGYSRSQPVIINDPNDANKCVVYHLSGDYLYKISIDLNNDIYHIDARCKLNQGGSSLSHPTYYNNMIFFGTHNGYLAVVRASDLTPVVQKMHAGFSIVSAPYIANGNQVVVGYYNPGGRSGLLVYNISDNSYHSYGDIPGWVTSSGVKVGSKFYFLSDDDYSAGFLYEWKVGDDEVTRTVVDEHYGTAYNASLASGGAASLTYFDGKIMFLDKSGNFYIYLPNSESLWINRATKQYEKRITWHSPGATIVNGIPIASVPISDNIGSNEADVFNGHGISYISSITAPPPQTHKWNSDSNTMKISRGMDLAPIFIVDTKTRSSYLMYADIGGNFRVGKVDSNFQVNRVTDFFDKDISNDYIGGGGVFSEISFSENKLVFSTKDGALHIFAPQSIIPNDLSINNLNITNVTRNEKVIVSDREEQKIKLGNDYVGSFKINSSFEKDIKVNRNLVYGITALDESKKAIESGSILAEGNVVIPSISPKTSYEFPKDFADVAKIDKIRFKIPANDKIKYINIHAKLQTGNDEADWKAPDIDENNSLDLMLEVEPPNLAVSNYSGPNEIATDTSTINVGCVISNNWITPFSGVPYSIQIDGINCTVNGNPKLEVPLLLKGYTFNVNIPATINKARELHTVKITINDENNPHPKENNYSDNVITGTLKFIQPLPNKSGGDLDVVVSAKGISDPVANSWLSGADIIKKVTTKSGYGIPLVAEVHKFNYVPKPTGDGKWTYYTDFNMSSATLSIDSNLILSSAGYEIVHSEGSYGERLRMMPKKFTSGLSKREIYTEPKQWDSSTYKISVTITAPATWVEHYMYWEPYWKWHPPVYDYEDWTDAEGNEHSRRVLVEEGWWEGKWLWTEENRSGTYSGSDTIDVTIRGSMFDDDQQVITQ